MLDGQMKHPKKTFYILLSLLYFMPLFWELKVFEESPKLFYGLITWSLMGFGLLMVSFRFFKRSLKATFQKQGKAQETSLPMPSKLKEWVKEKETYQQSLLKELDSLRKGQSQQVKELTQVSIDLQSQLEKKETILSEYRSTLQDQREVIEKKQKDIQLLQVRVNDLKYELENVLKLKAHDPQDTLPFFQTTPLSLENPEVPSPSLSNSLQHKLDRYVKMAMTLNSSYHLTKNQGRSPQVPLGSLIIDQRRLFDRLQNEENEALMVYSREEKRLIFINNQITSLLGWSPERFLTDFSFLIQKNYIDWREALEEVKVQEQKNLRLLMKAKSGKEVLTHCYLKEVPEGVFKGHIIGLLSSPTKN